VCPGPLFTHRRIARPRPRRLASGDGALHADTAVTINGGKLTVTAFDEGIASAAGEALLPALCPAVPRPRAALLGNDAPLAVERDGQPLRELLIVIAHANHGRNAQLHRQGVRVAAGVAVAGNQPGGPAQVGDQSAVAGRDHDNVVAIYPVVRQAGGQRQAAHAPADHLIQHAQPAGEDDRDRLDAHQVGGADQVGRDAGRHDHRLALADQPGLQRLLQG
ncbi:hypothetical protein RZS08_08460, partial [Arthrospira platensis SPKY1]|nr:hypothetical protein [Arthrospira platensis SPKY1]